MTLQAFDDDVYKYIGTYWLFRTCPPSIDAEKVLGYLFVSAIVQGLELGLRWLHDRSVNGGYYWDRAEEMLGYDLYPS